MLISSRATAGANDLAATTSTTVTIPATVQAGDVLFLLTANRNATTDPTVADDDSGGNTWARVTGQDNTGSGDLWWKRATAATASKTITVSNATTSVSACLSVFSGMLRAGTPYEAASAQANASGTESHTSINTLGAGRWLLVGIANLGNDNPVTSPDATDPNAITTVTIESLNNPTGTTNDCSTILCAAAQGAAGATGTITWAQTNGLTVSVAVALIPEFGAEVSETLHVTSTGAIQFVFPGGLHLSDTVSAAFAGDGALSQTAGPETLHLTDVATAVLTPLLATLTETLHVSEAATPLLGGLATTATETLHVSETATAALTPLLATLTETLHVSESPGTPSLTGDLAQALTETLHVAIAGRIEVLGTLRISETVSATLGGDLSQTSAETLHVTDSVTAALPVLEARPAETLHVTETAAASMGLMAAPTETLHLADVVTASGGDLLAAPAETLHVSDTVAASLVASGTLTAALTETLHVSLAGEIQVLGRIRVSDADLTAARQDPNDLTAAALAETLHLTDTPTAARVDLVLVASLAETLHLSDAVTALRSGAFEASVSEALHLADAVESYAGLDDPELVHVTETVTAARTDAALTASLTETLHVSETATLRMGDLVAAVLTDAIHVTEAASASLTPLERSLTEALHLADSAPGAALAAEGTLTTSLAETLHLAETVTLFLAPLLAAPAETLHLTESVTGAALAAEGELTLAVSESLDVQETVTARLSLLLLTVAETLQVSEAVATSLELTASLTEALHVAEGPVQAQQVGIALVVVVSETLALAEAVTDGRLTPLEAVLAEPLHLTDEVTIYVAGTLLVDLTETVIVRETLYPERPPVIAGTAIFETVLRGVAIFHEE